MFRRASLGRILLSSGGGRLKVMMERSRGSSYLEGSIGRESLGCLKYNACDIAASVYC